LTKKVFNSFSNKSLLPVENKKDVLEGRMLGKRPRGKPRRGMIDDLMEGSFMKMKRRAEGRKEWREWVPGACLRAEHL